MTTAGFLLAADGKPNLKLLLFLLVGTSVIIGSACVVNNILDRKIDALMSRTKKRALVTGSIKPMQAIVFAVSLGLIGFGTLVFLVNTLTALVGLTGYLAYTVLYSLAKRRTVHGTLIGTISGATPPVAGYTAVTDRLDTTALLLFMLLVFWQMPHFYAIAMYRAKEYNRAKLPVLPLVKGSRRAKLETSIYIALFTATCIFLTTLGTASKVFAILMVLAGFAWLLRGWSNNNLPAEEWGKQMFLFSLVVLVLSSSLLAASPWLP